MSSEPIVFEKWSFCFLSMNFTAVWAGYFVHHSFLYTLITVHQSLFQNTSQAWTPKLFILYIDDICEVSELLHFVLFAVDTNLFCSGDNLITWSNNIENEMVKYEILVWYK